MQADVPEADLSWKQILANDPEQRTVPWFSIKITNNATASGGGGYSSLRNSIQKPLIVLMIVVALVLLIACANVASLLLRRRRRQREIAIRLLSGPRRARLVCQLVLETLVVSLLGGILGLAFAWGSMRVLLALMPTGMVPLTLNLSA